jgi:heat shock protein HslJ
MRTSVVAIALVLAACGGGGGAAPTASAEPDLDLTGSWELTAGTGVPIVEDYPITLSFTGSDVGGISACNQYGGQVSLAGGEFSIEGLGGTDMACEPAVMAAEQGYMASLVQVSRVSRDGEELVLSGPDVELRFARLADPPTADLVDRVWVLETLVVGDVAGPALGERATLELSSDGEITGSTGCRSFSGQWLESGNQIDAPILGMDERECPAELQEQDSHVVSVIGDGFVPTIEGDLLTLTDPGSIGLVYRADD